MGPQTDLWKPISRDGTKMWQHEKSKIIIYFNPEKLENADNFIVCIDTNAVIQSKQELFTLAKKYSKTLFAISQQVLAELDINKTRSQNQNKHCRFILEKFQTLPNFEVQS